MSLRNTLVLFAALALPLGCADADRVDVVPVLTNGNCQTNESGVRLIDYATLAKFRATHLIGMSESAEATQNPLHLIAIVPGEYPTPGYTVALQAVPELSGGAMTLKIKVEQPAKDAILAQMITHPCLVVGVADPAVTRVRVIDETTAVLGEVDLPKAP
jgi:PrcB C-terminal